MNNTFHVNVSRHNDFMTISLNNEDGQLKCWDYIEIYLFLCILVIVQVFESYFSNFMTDTVLQLLNRQSYANTLTARTKISF